MTQFEDFPKICIKCKRSDIELFKFTHSATNIKGKHKYSTVNIRFPVCSSCKQEFERWKKIVDAFQSMKHTSFISLFVAIFLGYEIFHGILSGLFVVLFFITLILTIIGIVLFIITKIHPNKISNYINLKKTGEVNIKDKELQKEIAEYAVSKKGMQILKEVMGVSMIICPKCGSHQQNGIDFCSMCGKELRYL